MTSTKLKISLVSDLHLDIGGYLTLPGGDVLILSGDVCEAREFGNEFRATKSIGRKPGAFPCHDFFEFEVSKYKKVFYVMGNHEFYRGRFDKTKSLLESMVPENVTILENDVVEYEGIMFMGATLWTNLNNADSLTMYHIKSMLNDYHVIQNFYPDKGLYHKLIPEYTFRTHVKTMQYFREQLSIHRDKPFVVLTHHAPSFASVPECYKDDYLMNGGYASNLSEDILDNPNIKYWLHGHMHHPVDYMIGDTRVLANPRGYPGETETNGFDPNFTFEI